MLWAVKGLAYDLIDDPLFRAIFAPCIPANMTRNTLREEMKTLGAKVLGDVFAKLKGAQITLGVDGWTNIRHRYQIVIFLCAVFHPHA